MQNPSNSLEQTTQHKKQNTDEAREIMGQDASKSIIMHHLSSFVDNDLDAVVSDYTNESVLITQDTTYKGVEEIKTFFSALMVHFPKQKSSFELTKLVVHQRLVYIAWHAKTPSVNVSLGSDTFIIKNGKISQQTFAGELKLIG